MIWTQAVLPLIVGLVAISLQSATAEDIIPSKGNNSTVGKPGNKTYFDSVPLADNFLYKLFACRGKPNGLRLPIAGSCVDYYECQQDMAYRRSCSEGFHFSNHGLACLDARISKCQPEQVHIKCEGLCCSRADGLYPALGSCSDFLICLNGQTYRRSCGSVLQFSAKSLTCDIPERARCSIEVDKEIIEEEKEPEEEEQAPQKKPIMYMISHRVCAGKPNGYTVPIYASCNKFYLCVDGAGYLKSCGTLQFNPKKHYCDLRTRMYCPEWEEDDVILDEDEYMPVEVLPMPMPRPDIKPIPFPAVDEREEEEIASAQRPHYNPLAGKRPKPPVAVEEAEEEEVEIAPAQRPHYNPLAGKRPKPPVVVEEAEEEEVEDFVPHWGKKPAKRPAVPKDFEIEEEEVSESLLVPPNMELPTLNICSDQPVGALMSYPGDCSKYIRCRWDWYERRVAEVISCPEEMHFNSKSKYCDWPENAGCKADSKKAHSIRKKQKKF